MNMNIYILIIEEINRGNAPAIFGEVFQLLDRKSEIRDFDDDGYPIGTSEYGITNANIAKIVYGDSKHKVRIPSNLSILGTMNTSDQNVFTLDTAFQRRWEMRLINESGLYSLILSSKMPNAKKFKHWVTAEVLPAIRKHGMYAIDEILENPDLAIAALTQLKEERERRKQLECLALVQRQQIAEMQPKASYYDLILQNKNTVPITQIAKDYGMSGRKFNELLHELGVQYKFRKTWLLYQQYAECGYTQSRTYAIDESRSVMHTYWTQKGRLFLYDLLKNEGILPVIEQED